MERTRFCKIFDISMVNAVKKPLILPIILTKNYEKIDFEKFTNINIEKLLEKPEIKQINDILSDKQIFKGLNLLISLNSLLDIKP